MPLLDSEVWRIKSELGYNLLQVGAEPYISIVAIFSQVIQPYLTGGVLTSSSTSVGIVGSSDCAAPVALTLASASGVLAGQTLVVDVDDRQESATISALTGAVATLLLRKEHSGTYPVLVEGPESIVRENLTRIRAAKAKMAESYGSGALKKVDEVEFYDSKGKTYFGILGEELSFWRRELAACLGVVNGWDRLRGAGSRCAVY